MGKLYYQRLRWGYKVHNDLLLIPFICSPYIMLGKQEYFCLQGKDYNKGKKRQIYWEKKRYFKAGSCLYKKKKAHSTKKKLDCPVKFCVKKIYRYTSYKVSIDTKNNREKINQNLRNDFETLKKNKKNYKNLGSLQYLVIFPNENQHRSAIRGKLPLLFSQQIQEWLISFANK